jgi:hypothetical protein
MRSATKNHVTATGKVLGAATISNIILIQQEAKKISKGQHFPWHVPRLTTDLAKNIGVPNHLQITTGLSLVAPITDLMDTRNYVVHPSRETEIAYKRVATKYGYPKLGPADLLSIRSVGRETMFEKWVNNLRIMILIAIR